MAASRRHPAKRQRLDGHSRPILDTSENVHYHVPLQISDTCELVPTSEELLELAGYGDESQTIASKEQERVCFGMVSVTDPSNKLYLIIVRFHPS